MWKWLDSIPLPLLAIVAIYLLLAPFQPMPHALEKLIMLKNGDLKRPIDIFDLFLHTTPTILLILKLARTYLRS
jgi:hypothetical protein